MQTTLTASIITANIIFK